MAERPGLAPRVLPALQNPRRLEPDQCLCHGELGQSRDGRQQRRPYFILTQDRAGLRHCLGLAGAVEPRSEAFVQSRRNCRHARRCRPACTLLGQGACELLHEERDAAGARGQITAELRRRGVAAQRREQPSRLGLLQPLQFERHGARPGLAGWQRELFPRGQHHQETCGRGLRHHSLQELQCRWIEPLGVLHEEDKRARPRDACDRRRQCVQRQRPQPCRSDAAQHRRLAFPGEAQQVGERREPHIVLGASVVQQQQVSQAVERILCPRTARTR
jgi:hypothetical protein